MYIFFEMKYTSDNQYSYCTWSNEMLE